MMAARLEQIARQAGVSKATVSRVLNERPGVSARTRMAVMAALESLGYERPSTLRPRSFGLVGLIVPELQNPIFPSTPRSSRPTSPGTGSRPCSAR
ncbi:LacI family DNA-binding transcriptional regulator [Thermocatellispora tengchongensis]